MDNYVNTIIELLEQELTEIKEKNSDKYGQYSLVIANERAMDEERFYSHNTIYIVVKFLSSYIYYGQAVVPITLRILSEQNTIEIAQQLMIEFAMTYNLKENDTQTIKQVYQTPSVTTNFNEVFTGYRTAFFVTGTFVISKNSNPFKVEIAPTDDIYDSENLDNNVFAVISSGLSSIIQTDSQPFYDTNGNIDTLGQFRAVGISFSTFMIDSAFCNKCLDVALGLNGRTPKTKFKLKITFKNGRTITHDFTLCNFDDSQNIGEFPALKLSFSI